MAKCPFNENLRCLDCRLLEDHKCIFKRLTEIVVDLDDLKTIGNSLCQLINDQNTDSH